MALRIMGINCQRIWLCFQMSTKILLAEKTTLFRCVCSKLTIKTVTLFYPANIYLFKINNGNGKKRCEICSKLTIKTPKRRLSFYNPWKNEGVYRRKQRKRDVILVLLLLTWTYFTPFSSVSSVSLSISHENNRKL